MIVDCHTHMAFPASETERAKHREASGKLGCAIVLPDPGEDSVQTNQHLSEYVARGRNVVGFALVHPVRDRVGAKTISMLASDLGLKGAVVYCPSDPFHPTHSRAMKFYAAAQELGMPVFFHNGSPFDPKAVLEYAQPLLLDEVARQFPALKIIIGTMGLPFLPQTISMLAKHPNVYADLTISPHKTWEVYNIVVGAYEAGVMDKLLFGSGYPVSDPGHCVETLLGFNRLLADTKLPTVPRERLRSIVERDTLALLGIRV